MVNKNYLAGRRFEYKVKKYYENQGFTVLRTSGSHGFADLVAVKNDARIIIFIQCKNQKPTKQELKEFEEFSWLNVVDMHTWILTEMVYPDKLKDWNKSKKDKLKGGD
jgi:HJR/Mrr/RecB family endonuclease